MDYGPFGFIDMYRPEFAKWTGSGDHFAFMNQPRAALANIGTLADALKPLLDSAGKQALDEKLEAAQVTVEGEVETMWRSKLGLRDSSTEGRKLFVALER